MANGLLNQLLLQQSEQTAPMQRRFNLQEYLTGAGQMANQIARQEERQRQNSLRNLIAAREQEGIGFDQLSNEAAKYDMNAANTMRDEFRNSYKFNQQQSDAELARFKREMADYWFGEVLRRARKDGKPDGELKNITYEAASMIAPYDSELAYKLLRDSENAYSTERKLEAAANKPQKPQKDDTEAINANQKKYSVPAQDFDKNPVQYRENWVLSDVDSALKRWKTGGEYDSNKYAHYKGYSRPIWLPMEDALMAEVRRRFPKYNKSASQFEAARKWLQGLSDDKISPIIGDVLMSKQEEIEAQQNDTLKTNVSVNNGKVVGGDVPANSDGGLNLPDSLVSYDANTGAKRVNDDAVAELNTYIPELFTKDDFRKAYKLASQLSGLESGENTAYKDVKKQIDDRQKEVKEDKALLEAAGLKNVDAAFEKYKHLFGNRAAMSTLRQMMNFNSFIEGFYSDSPMTVIVNGLLVGEPNYKPTVDEFKQAKRLHGDISQETQTLLANMGIPGVSKWADLQNDYNALIATGRAAVSQARSVWQSMTDGMNPEQKKEVRQLLRLGDEAMKFLEPKSNGKYERLAMNKEEYDKKNSFKKKKEMEDSEFTIGDEVTATSLNDLEGF